MLSPLSPSSLSLLNKPSDHWALSPYLFLRLALTLALAEGKGCVFTYDAVGSYERVGYGNQRTGSTLIMPFLDSQLKSPSPLLLPAQDAVTPLVKYEAVDLVKTVFASATERDIYIGDKLEIVILNADGIRREYMHKASLRKFYIMVLKL
ncbi:proteasome subunit beta type-1-like isoform X4 [Durio zibethinus]|uniref:Proteasome subunit beta type-1-like isoform X4 n=1 Tax=Durio zibethinus TaxID=66656 RepID=A0A6P5YD38_DURZI|nr:proteasome subunit beta type-1-like isoform X4 [Durio zibethinus]